ncbi:hypothetical protein PIB30_062070 [Stylosanthes scabra]|uniref:Uncharacterized protein n=1 Tax=Stylosanthes scabra TaxID=79078 RepID=A0ABU6ULK6_9FABA|nr:hypothetical protein [Stylosanthes scabra]
MGSVAPLQLHPNAWSSIRCFELVTQFLELPQDPEVFLYLFKFYSSNTSGRYFKIFPVDSHRPFWLSVEGEGRFPSYWSEQAGFDIVSVTYQRLNAEQKDTADILVHLFTKNNLAPKSLLTNSEEARRVIVEMAGNDVTLARLRNILRPPPTRAIPTSSGPSSAGRAVSPPIVPATRVVPEGGSSSEAGKETDQLVEISSPIREGEETLPIQTSPRKQSGEESLASSKRPRVSEGGSHEFRAMDRSFDASGFIGAHLLGPRASEALRDYGPVESVRWAG